MDNIMIELKAKDGCIYTNGELYSTDVFLSELDSPNNWEEITEEEARERQMQEQETEQIF